MFLVNIIDDPLETIEHPLRIEVADLHILPASFTVKLQDASQFHPGTDKITLPVLRESHPRLSSRPVDADLDDIRISAAHKRVDRHVVYDTSVNITLPVLHLLVLESDEIGACQQVVLQSAFRYVGDAKLQFFSVCQGKCLDTELLPRGPDLLLIYSLMYEPPKGRDIHTALCEQPECFRYNAPQCLFPLEKLLHPLIIYIHYAGKRDLAPDLLSFLHIIHADQRAVERTHRSPGNSIDTYAGLLKCFPRSDLVGASCPAPVKDEPVFFCQIQQWSHMVT